MAEYIDKQIILDKCQRLIDVERKQGSDVMNYGRERVNQTEVIMEYIEYMTPTTDVVERSTMEILCNEYLSKCNCCDECCAETYCILNSLRTENRDCVNNLITYFTKRNIGE